MEATPAVSITIPYSVTRHELPAEIPSRDTIENTKPHLSRSQGVKVVGVGPHFVVKFGEEVSLEEGRMMIYLQQTTSIRVPKIYAMKEEDGKTFIIMERLPGDTLYNVWSELTAHEKESIANQLRQIFNELRALRSTNFCSLGNRPLRDYILRAEAEKPDQQFAGPFETEAEFNDALVQKYRSKRGHLQEKASFYSRAFPFVLAGHEPIFTHADFHPQNVIWNQKDGSAVLIDWEMAGWYSSYWEFARAMFKFNRNAWQDGWVEFVESILDPFLNEWAWMQMLTPDLGL